MLIGISACAKKDAPPPAAAYSMMVDLYSGRQNPEVELSPQVADEIHGELDRRAAELTSPAEPPAPLGFRGFVITPSGDSRPVLRVTRDSVYAIRDGVTEKLTDPEGRFYDLVLEDVRTRLPRDVLDALA